MAPLPWSGWIALRGVAVGPGAVRYRVPISAFPNRRGTRREAAGPGRRPDLLCANLSDIRWNSCKEDYGGVPTARDRFWRGSEKPAPRRGATPGDPDDPSPIRLDPVGSRSEQPAATAGLRPIRRITMSGTTSIREEV